MRTRLTLDQRDLQAARSIRLSAVTELPIGPTNAAIFPGFSVTSGSIPFRGQQDSKRAEQKTFWPTSTSLFRFRLCSEDYKLAARLGKRQCGRMHAVEICARTENPAKQVAGSIVLRRFEEFGVIFQPVKEPVGEPSQIIPFNRSRIDEFVQARRKTRIPCSIYN